MNVLKRIKWAQSLLAGFVLLSFFGCSGAVQMMSLPYFLLVKDTRIQPKWEKQMFESQKDEKKILFLTYCDNNIKWTYGNIDEELQSNINTIVNSVPKNRLEVVPTHKVQSWMDQNPDWKDMDPASIGKTFEVDFVATARIDQYTENTSADQWLRQGYIEVTLELWDAKREELRIDEVVSIEYPKHGPAPLSDLQTDRNFRNKMLRHVANDISFYFRPYETSDITATSYSISD